jgi:hypothetical protein
MAENITINFAGPQVGVKYNAETSEAVFHDEVIAIEIGVQVLAAQAILNRQKEGRPVPSVFVAIVEAHTFKDLL